MIMLLKWILWCVCVVFCKIKRIVLIESLVDLYEWKYSLESYEGILSKHLCILSISFTTYEIINPGNYRYGTKASDIYDKMNFLSSAGL